MKLWKKKLAAKLLMTGTPQKYPDLCIKSTNNTDGSVYIVILDRPHRMNAFSIEMGEALLNLPNLLPNKTRAVVVTGSGDKAFSTGRDLKDSKKHSPDEQAQYLQVAQKASLAMKNSEIPVIAAINGFCFGWGLEMALGCDLRVVYKNAKLCFPETSLGIFPGAMGSVFLPRLVGPAIAKDLILTSRRFSGTEAFSLGVANRLADSPKEAVTVAVELAYQIAQNGPLGVQSARRVIDKGLDGSFDDHVTISNRLRLKLDGTADFKEALLAFEQKRRPVFCGK